MVFPLFIDVCCGRRGQAGPKKAAPRKVLLFNSYNQVSLVVLSMHNLFTAVKTVGTDVVTSMSLTSGRFF